VAAALILVTTACSSAGPSSTSDAAGQTASAAPKFCTDLANDNVLHALPKVLQKAVLGRPGATESLHAAADNLRSYSSNGLGEEAQQSADALDKLADDPTNAAVVSAFASRMHRLDQEMEAQCGSVRQ
jgi:hypothetical protein